MKGLMRGFIIKIAATAAVLGSVVLFAYAYRLTALGYLSDNILAVSAEVDIRESLEDAVEEPVFLTEFQAGDAVYQRGNTRYIGENKARIRENYPFFINEGAGLYYFESMGSMITYDCESLESLDGTMIVNGRLYDETGMMMEDEDYIFAALDNGLFVNVMPAKIHRTGQSHDLGNNSIILFEEDQLTCMTVFEDALVPNKITGLYGATISIGPYTYDYDELLTALGVLAGETSKSIQHLDKDDNLMADLDEGEAGDGAGKRKNGDDELGTNANELTDFSDGSEGSLNQGEDGSAGDDDETDEIDPEDADASEEEKRTETEVKDQKSDSKANEEAVLNSKGSQTEGQPLFPMMGDSWGSFPSSTGDSYGDNIIAGSDQSNGSNNSNGTNYPDGSIENGKPSGPVGGGGMSGSNNSGGTEGPDGPDGSGSQGAPDGSAGSGGSNNTPGSNESSGSGGSDNMGGGSGGNAGNTSGSEGSGSGDSDANAGGNGTGNVTDGSGSGDDVIFPDVSGGNQEGNQESGDSDSKGDSGQQGGSGSSSSGNNEDPEEGSDGFDGEPEEGGSSDSVGGVHHYMKPQVFISDISAGVYEVTGNIEILDPDMRLKRVIMRVYSADNGKSISRKNLRAGGTFAVPNVNPDTEVLLEGSFTWLNDDGEKVTEIFLERVPLKTLPIEGNVTPIYVTYSRPEQYYSEMIQIPDLKFESEDPDSLNYISRVQLDVTPDISGEEELKISGQTLRKLRMGEVCDWESDSLFKTMTEYRWGMGLYDRFGNELPTIGTLTDTTKTCGRTPSASLLLSENIVGTQKVSVTISNPDSIELSDVYVSVFDTDHIEHGALPIFEENPETGDTYYRKMIHATGLSQVNIVDLPAGRNYTIRAFATYDIGNYDEPHINVSEILGTVNIYTAPISNLGIPYYSAEFVKNSITDSAARLDISLLSRTNENLKPLLSEITVALSGAANGPLDTVLKREELSKPLAFFKEGNTYLLQEESVLKGKPQITLAYYGDDDDQINAWDLILQGAQISVQYPEGKFASNTDYSVSIKTAAIQGGETYNVSGASGMANMRTLKKEAKITYENMFSISDFVEFHNFVIEDPDNAILNRTVTMRLYGDGRLIQSKTLETNHVYGTEEMIRFTSLTQGTSYSLVISCLEYNIGHTSETWKSNYTFSDQAILFQIGDGLEGFLTLDGVSKDETGNDDFIAGVDLEILDRKNDLAVNPIYRLRYRRASGIEATDRDFREIKVEEVELDVVDGIVQSVSELLQFGVDKNCTYNLILEVDLYGRTFVLDEVRFTTEQEIIAIASDADLALLKQYPDASFVVVADITSSKQNIVEDFSGTIDFQGHTLTRTTHRYLFYDLLRGSVIKNLVLDFRIPAGHASFGYCNGLVHNNYGTIQNVIVNIHQESRDQSSYNGIASSNRGIIENFVVKIDNELYGQIVNGVVRTNYSIVRNGLIYGGNLIAASGVQGGSSSYAHAHNGGIVGNNVSGGVVSNVYSLVSVVTERASNMEQSGTIAGVSGGIVKNAYSVGDRYVYGFTNGIQDAYSILNDYGSAVSINNRSASEVYFLSESGSVYNQANQNKYNANIPLEGQYLWDKVWQRQILGTEGFYIDDMIEAGCYPRVILPEFMMAKQEAIPLPAIEPAPVPQFITADILEQNDDEVIANLSFMNVNSQEITELNVDGLEVEILDGQGTHEGAYYVQVRLHNPTKFVSSYNVTSLRYKVNKTSDITQLIPQDGSMNVSFYYPIRNANDFGRIQDHPEENYKLMNDLYFTNSYTEDYMVEQAFTGTLDGNGHTLYNMSNPRGWIFKHVNGGTIRNLRAENLNLIPDARYQKAPEVGFIGKANNFATVEQVHVRNVKLEACQYGGALIGLAEYVELKDCSAVDVSIQSYLYGTYKLYLGGLVGNLTGTPINNSYVSNFTIIAEEGNNLEGAGGIVGRSGSSCAIENVYAKGSIKSAFAKIGGIVGAANSSVSRAWAEVKLDAKAGSAGGIVGSVDSELELSRLISVGDIYFGGSIDSLGRIYGYKLAATEVTMSYAVGCSDQVIGQQKSLELLDAAALFAYDDLKKQETYRDMAILGTSFDISGAGGYPVEEGYFPMLYGTDDELLPWQTPPVQKDTSLKVSIVERGSTDSGSYKIALEIQKNNWEIVSIQADGLDLGSEVRRESAQGIVSSRFDNITPLRYMDFYQLSVTFKKAGSSEEQTVIVGLDFGEPLCLVIRSGSEWVDAMNYRGMNGENFRIEGTIDLQAYRNEALPMNLVIHRLIGGEDSKIININHTALKPNDSMIATLTGGMSGVSFENVTMRMRSDSSGGSNFGIVGSSSAEIYDVTFKDVNISVKGTSNVGCIGTSSADIHDITLENIVISGSGSNHGGLCGQLQGRINNVEGIGTPQTWSIEGVNYVGGIVGMQQNRAQDVSLSGGYIYATGKYAGGLFGELAASGANVPSEDNNMRLHAGTARTENTSGDREYSVIVKGDGDYVGGLIGQMKGNSKINDYLTAVNVNVSGIQYVSGLMGAYSWGHIHNSKLSDSRVYAKGAYTSGIANSGAYYRGCLVENSEIIGTSPAGGIAGSYIIIMQNCYVENSRISGSGEKGVGGIAGTSGENTDTNDTSIVTSGVLNCTVNAGEAKNVGGLMGHMEKYRLYNSYVIDTTVNGLSNVGGAVGRAKSTRYYGLAIQADVNAAAENAGLFAGSAIGFFYPSKYKPTYPFLQLYQSYFTGDVSANTGNAAGLIGLYLPGDDYRDTTGKLLEAAQLKPEHMTTAGTTTESSRMPKYESIIVAPNTIKSTIGKASWVVNVQGSENIVSDDFKMNRSAYYAGTVKIDQSGSVMFSELGADKILEFNNKGFLMRTTADMTDPARPMYGWAEGCLGFNTTYWDFSGLSASLSVADRRMPYAKGDTYDSADTYQIPATMKVENKMKAAGGITIPGNQSAQPSTLSLRPVREEEISLSVYSSGAGTINLEFSKDLSEPIAVQIRSADGVLWEETTTERVLTFTYDYQTPLTVTVGEDELTVEVDPEEICKTVAVYGNDYAYLTAGGAYLSDTLVDGDYIHLGMWQDQGLCALNLDGGVVNLESGEQVGTIAVETVALTDTIPLHKSEYEGYHLETYAGFTDTGSTRMEGYQAVAKNGAFFLIDAESPIRMDQYIAGAYQGREYLTVLGDDGVLYDLGMDEITLPEEFSNYGIGEISNTLDGSGYLVIGRRTDGSLFGFNYITGEELELVQPETSEISFVAYAMDWIDSKFGSVLRAARSSYLVESDSMGNVNTEEVDRLLDEQSGNPSSIASAMKGGTVSDIMQEDVYGETDLSSNEDEAVEEKTEKTDSNEEQSEKADGSEEEQEEVVEEAASETDEVKDAEEAKGPVDEEADPETEDEDAADGAAEVSAEGESGDADMSGSEQSEETVAETDAAGTMDAEIKDTEVADETQPDAADANIDETEDEKPDVEDVSIDETEGEKPNVADVNADDTEGGELITESTNTDVTEGEKPDAAGVSADEVDGEQPDAADADTEVSDENQKDAAASGTDDSDEQKQNSVDENMVEDEKSPTIVSSTKTAKYIPVYSASKGGYEYYKIEDLLTKDAAELNSLEDKITLLNNAGIVGDFQKVEEKVHTDERQRTGWLLMMLSASMIGLALVGIYYKKRQK